MKETPITVSIVIPMRNEEKRIASCLNSILANDFPKDEMEIIVADGRSEDRSRQIVEELASRHPQIRIIDNPKRIVPPGVNAAISLSRGRYIIRMDAHSEYPSDYVNACVRELESGVADVVGGRLITRPGDHTGVAQAIALVSQHPFGVGNSGFRLGWQGRYVDTVPFGAFRREVFERVGLFRESLVRHQDFEMNARVRAAGGKIFLSPAISLTYYNLPTLGKWIKRTFRDPLWVGRTWVRYPITFCWRHGAPLALLLAMALPLAFSSVISFAPVISLGVLGLYLAAALASSIHIALRHGLKLLPPAAFLFVSLHMLYALGLLSGVLTYFVVPKEERTGHFRHRGRLRRLWSSVKSVRLSGRQWSAAAIAATGVCLGVLLAREQWIYALALFVVAVLVLWPVEATLGGFAFLLPFDSVSRLGASPEARALTWYVGAAVALVLLILGVTNDRFRVPPRTSWYWLGLLCWGALSMFWALDPAIVSTGLPTAIGLLALYMLVVSFEITEQQLRRIAFLAIAGGLAASLISIQDFRDGIWTVESRMSLIAGTRQADPNDFAASLLMPLTLAVASLVSSRKFLERVFMLAAVLAVGFAILLTMSRGALVALIFAALIFAYRLKRNRWILFFFSLLPLSTLVLPPLFFVRLKEALLNGGAGRLDIWMVGFNAFKHFFVHGAGLGNFVSAYEQFRAMAPTFRGYSRPAHNVYLQVAVELGVLGICLLVAAVVTQLRSVHRAIARSRIARSYALLVGCEAMIWSMLAAAFFLNLLWEKTFWMVWIFSALAVQSPAESRVSAIGQAPRNVLLPINNANLLPQPCFETE